MDIYCVHQGPLTPYLWGLLAAYVPERFYLGGANIFYFLYFLGGVILVFAVGHLMGLLREFVCHFIENGRLIKYIVKRTEKIFCNKENTILNT